MRGRIAVLILGMALGVGLLTPSAAQAHGEFADPGVETPVHDGAASPQTRDDTPDHPGCHDGGITCGHALSLASPDAVLPFPARAAIIPAFIAANPRTAVTKVNLRPPR